MDAAYPPNPRFSCNGEVLHAPATQGPEENGRARETAYRSSHEKRRTGTHRNYFCFFFSSSITNFLPHALHFPSSVIVGCLSACMPQTPHFDISITSFPLRSYDNHPKKRRPSPGQGIAAAGIEDPRCRCRCGRYLRKRSTGCAPFSSWRYSLPFFRTCSSMTCSLGTPPALTASWYFLNSESFGIRSPGMNSVLLAL